VELVGKQTDRDDKTLWCRYYIDDFNTAKVRILHIRRGIYRIVGGGKFIGKIIDASDVYPRLMAVTYLFFADEYY
jgi:hypothetical protein